MEKTGGGGAQRSFVLSFKIRFPPSPFPLNAAKAMWGARDPAGICRRGRDLPRRKTPSQLVLGQRLPDERGHWGAGQGRAGPLFRSLLIGHVRVLARFPFAKKMDKTVVNARSRKTRLTGRSRKTRPQ